MSYETPPPPQQAHYPRPNMPMMGPMGPSQPFQGDKIYVGIEIATVAIGFIMFYFMMPSILSQVIQQMGENSNGPKPSVAFVQMIMNFGLGCGLIIAIPIEYFILSGIWKGKRWAFIVSVVFMALGLLSQIGNFDKYLLLSIYGFIQNGAKLVYCIMRMSGKVGTPLN